MVPKLSGFFQIFSHFPDGFKTVRNCPDLFPFSGSFQNCLELSRSFSLFRTVSKLPGFFQIFFHFPDGFKTLRIFPNHFPFTGQFHNCLDFSRSFPIIWMVLKLSGCDYHIYCILAKEHWIRIIWQCCERQTRTFLGLSRKTDACASSGKFLRVESCYPESFGFLRLCKSA